MDKEAFFNHCKALAGDTSDAPWTDCDLAGFFQSFRPNGQALEPLFRDIPGGDEIYSRLKQIYAATASSYQRGTETDAYFIVRKPQKIDIDMLSRSAAAQLTNWRRIAEQNQELELVDLLTPLPDINVSTDEPPPVDPNDNDSLDVLIYEVQGDWHDSLSPLCSYAEWMREAFYHIACDYYLAQYVTWPWYQRSSSIDDPFKPHFQMWLRGAELRCQSPDEVTLFCQR